MENNYVALADIANTVPKRHLRNTGLIWLVVVLIFLLEGCGSSFSTAHLTSHTIQATPSTPILLTPPQTQKYEFTAQDSGMSVTYVVTSRFGITFNPQKYPKQHLQITCTPPDTIGSVSNLPSVKPPLYAVRYQAVRPGKCTIKNGNFMLKVTIIPLPD